MNRPILEDYIEHRGVIRAIDPREGILTVEVTDGGDCQGCAAAKLCGKSSSHSSTMLKVDVEYPSYFYVGQKVTLHGSETLHRRAIVLATVVPCVLLVGAMVMVYLLSGSQLVACLSALAAVVIFFVLLWVYRDKIDRDFSFTIVEMEGPQVEV